VSRTVGNALPAALGKLLGGTDLARAAGLTVLLLTVDEAGWPRVAMLSAGEVLATGDRDLRLALWPESGSTANLERRGLATLALVHGGAGWYVRCAAGREADLVLSGGRRLASFGLTVEEVLEDVVQYAELTGGIGFRLVEPERVLAAWTEAVEAMREAARG
jgi:hypothetical protein